MVTSDLDWTPRLCRRTVVSSLRLNIVLCWVYMGHCLQTETAIAPLSPADQMILHISMIVLVNCLMHETNSCVYKLIENTRTGIRNEEMSTKTKNKTLLNIISKTSSQLYHNNENKTSTRTLAVCLLLSALAQDQLPFLAFYIVSLT